MEDFLGRVAVVTGGASGIGRALAERFAQEGMRVALADVEAGPLMAAQREMEAAGHEVLAVVTDVADRGSVEAMADVVYERFGAVHVVCNNAGVYGGTGPTWAPTEQDWSWVMGVNVMGVVWGIRAFLPRMLAAGDEGHVINTSSIGGLVTGGGNIYSVSKFAVTRITEGLYYDLREAGARIGVTLLCPGVVATRIVSAERNRPRHLWRADEEERQAAIEVQREAAQQRFLETGMPPAEVAQMVIDAMRDGTFYLLTNPELMGWVEERHEGVREGRPPDPGGLERWLPKVRTG